MPTEKCSHSPSMKPLFKQRETTTEFHNWSKYRPQTDHGLLSPKLYIYSTTPLRRLKNTTVEEVAEKLYKSENQDAYYNTVSFRQNRHVIPNT